MEWVDGWVQLKYMLCRCRSRCENVHVQKDAKCAGCEINNLMKEKTCLDQALFVEYIICSSVFSVIT